MGKEQQDGPRKHGTGSTGQARNPQLRLNLSEKLFQDETDLMNRETIKNLESFRKLVVPKIESCSEENMSDGELQVHVSYNSQNSMFKSSQKV